MLLKIGGTSTYTYEQVLAYEVARELISSRIADCSAEIDDEKGKVPLDMARIEELREAMTALVIERRTMDMTDDAAVRTITAKYRRGPRVGASPQAMV